MLSAEDLSDLKTLSQRQAAAAIGISPRTLGRMTARGEGPLTRGLKAARQAISASSEVQPPESSPHEEGAPRPA
jgi:predicted DNA-binding protein (UPF0251 family)